MTLGILHLPDEILDSIIGSLLPELDPECPLLCIAGYDTPVDLLGCRLVCRTLNRIALPWLCRRLDLLEPYNLSRESAERQRQRITKKTTFFAYHADHAADVRLVHLNRRHVPEFTEALYPILSVEPPMFCRMSNLRVLILKYCRISWISGAEVFARLVMQPQLHTMILEGVDGMNWSLVESPLLNIKHLDIGYMRDMTCPLSLVSHLEAISLRTHFKPLARALESTTFPWDTLRELQVDNMEDWMALLDSYKAFSDNGGHLPTSLVELVIVHFADKTRVQCLLETFSLQPLHKFMLFDVFDLDIPLLEQVVTTFPELRELGLLTAADLRPWNAQLGDYLAILACLPKLQTLNWNFVDCHSTSRDANLTLQFQLDHMVATVAKDCPSLSCLRFLDKGAGISKIARITRNEKGEYKSHVLKSCVDDGHLYTSAWHGDRYNHTI